MARIEPRVQRMIEQLASMGGFRLRVPDDPPPALEGAARVWTINIEAQIANGWRWPNEIAWYQVAAWKAEDDQGRTIEDQADFDALIDDVELDEHYQGEQ